MEKLAGGGEAAPPARDHGGLGEEGGEGLEHGDGGEGEGEGWGGEGGGEGGGEAEWIVSQRWSEEASDSGFEMRRACPLRKGGGLVGWSLSEAGSSTVYGSSTGSGFGGGHLWECISRHME